MRSGLDTALAALWGARCAACHAPLSTPTRGPVCAPCWLAVERIRHCCTRCGLPLPFFAGVAVGNHDCLQRCGPCTLSPAGAIAMVRSAGIYDDALRRIVHAFKYRRHRSIATPLAMLMRQAGQEVLEGAHVAVPVPLHPLKTWRRGFNQAAVLGQNLPIRCLVALRRRRTRRAQAGLSAAERAQNVRGAFAPSWRCRFGHWLLEGRGYRLAPACVRRAVAERWSIAGRVVVLVDDVRTTGATLAECARVLQACGAREIRALTVARVDRR